MANGIIHVLLFGLFFSLFEPDLDLRLRVGGPRSSGLLPSFGAISLPRGLPSCEARCFCLLQGRLRIADSLSRGLPSSGGASLPRGLPSFEARCFRSLQGRLRIAGSLSRGLPSFGAVSLPGGITVFRSRMLPLIARRRRDCLKLMLSAVCYDKFLTLWDLVSSVFEVSFWAKAFEP